MQTGQIIVSKPLANGARHTFFEADIVPLEEPPNRAAAASDPALAHDRNDFIQRQIRLLGNQPQQNGRVRLERRDAASARLGRNASRFL
jgi:hypothetical protein